MARRRMTYSEKVSNQGLLHAVAQREDREASYQNKIGKLSLEITRLREENIRDQVEYAEAVKGVSQETLDKLQATIRAARNAERAAAEIIAAEVKSPETVEVATVAEAPASEVAAEAPETESVDSGSVAVL